MLCHMSIYPIYYDQTVDLEIERCNKPALIFCHLSIFGLGKVAVALLSGYLLLASVLFSCSYVAFDVYFKNQPLV